MIQKKVGHDVQGAGQTAREGLCGDGGLRCILRAQWVSEWEIIIWVLQEEERRDEP